MNAIIYSKPNCPYCVSAKNLLDMVNIPYEEKVLDKDFTREWILENFPDAKTFPQIVLDGEQIGGYADLAKRFG